MNLDKNLTIKKTYQETINVNDFLNNNRDCRELVGIKDGIYYCLEYGNDSGMFESPREWDNLWYLTGVGTTGFDYDANSMEDFDNNIYQTFGVDLDVVGIHERNNNISSFVSELKNKAKKHGLMIEPVTRYEHSISKFYRGIGGGWDSGVTGFAITTKDKIKEWYLHKIVTSKDKQNALEALDNELNIFSDAYNGFVYDYVAYNSNLDMVDILGGFYQTDVWYMQDHNELLNDIVAQLDVTDVKAV